MMELRPVDTPEDSPSLYLHDRVTVLIAEDDRGHYLLTRNCLRHASVENEIRWFEDGQATLDYLRSEEYRNHDTKYLLLLDVRMPKIDGLEVLRTIKADPRLKDIAVIMLTTSDDQELANHCYTLGCEAHVIKPPGHSLLRAIERVSRRFF